MANKGDEPAADCSVEITEDDLLAGKWFPKDCSLQVKYSNFYFCWISIVLKYLCIYIELLSEVHTPAGAEGQVHPEDLAGPLLDRL